MALWTPKPTFADFEETLALNPESSLARHNLAVLKKSKGNQDETDKLLTEAIEKNPKQRYSYAERGLLRMQAGNVSAWISSYKSADSKSEIALNVLASNVAVEIDAVGEHWADNVACALLASGLNSSIGMEKAARDLSGYAPPAGRGTTETLSLPGGGSFVLVDDAPIRASRRSAV